MVRNSGPWLMLEEGRIAFKILPGIPTEKKLVGRTILEWILKK